jgi:hypothetical protein
VIFLRQGVTGEVDTATFRSAFLTVIDAAKANPHADSASVVALGGGFTLDDHSYVEKFLSVLNYNIRGEDVLAATMRGDLTVGIKFDPNEIADSTEILDAIISNPKNAAARWEDRLRKQLDGRVVCIPEFELKRKALIRKYRLVALDEVGATAYILLLLLGAPFAMQLRKCKLDGCGQFFLLNANRKIRNYCTIEHSADGKSALTLKRVNKFRAKKANKRK